MSNKIPRRCQAEKMIDEEIAIQKVINIVEDAGCDPLLTDAICLLAQAKEKVSDWYDKNTTVKVIS